MPAAVVRKVFPYRLTVSINSVNAIYAVEPEHINIDFGKKKKKKEKSPFQIALLFLL